MNPECNISKLEKENFKVLGDESKEFYFVKVLENKLELSYFIVVNFNTNKIVIKRNELLTIHGVDENADYPGEEKVNDKICDTNPYLKEEHFKESLEPYGIKLNKITEFSENLFVSSNFTVDASKEKELLQKIELEFKKQIIK